ncbi:putative baseplate assembly protein [Mangrovicoccus algicola]|uniref:Putative baseplate assembly protein n=1 Tax=Mangrovicoccus algicola TaxID=2771008 RepID=A0A8J6YSK2_9RHOB|nr:putative baseplate assembly protein [Mangrovicoccus algicola]MBE3638373.1 putative baseplate assembly protein [Mangrovicoccus algicola]
MTLTPPNLDSRSFDDLLREARDRIPRYTPEWTNFNDSDPGMTLVKLHAWMTETILWELNRVPELNYVKFLELVGIDRAPARPARTRLRAGLDKLGGPGDPLVVDVPLGARVAVEDPDLATELVFETDASLRALNAAIAAVIVPAADPQGVARELVTAWQDGPTWLHHFDPLGPGSPGAALYLGLLLRPEAKPPMAQYSEDRMPAGTLVLYADTIEVLDAAAGQGGGIVEGPAAIRCADPAAAAAATARLEWQAYTGDLSAAGLFADDSDAGWSDLGVSGDGTAGLTRAGALALELPAGMTALSPLRLSREFWAGFGAPKPPRSQAELVAALQDAGGQELLAGLADHWQAMGIEDPDDLAAFAACGESVAQTVAKLAEPGVSVDPARLGLSDWEKIDPDLVQALPRAEDGYRDLCWIRARLRSAVPDGETGPQGLRALHLNTVAATQAVTRLEEVLGRSDGRPAQGFALSQLPVLIDPDTLLPDLRLSVAGETWTRVADFYRSGPSDGHYLLDPASGRITFGDGRRGRIPVAGAQIVAERYRHGGGRAGNVPEGTVTRIKGRIRGVKSMTNFRPATGGSDAETMEEVLLRAPSTLRSRDRAVTAQDFRDLALQTPGVPLHSATALARTAAVAQPDGSHALSERDGAVTLIVLPARDEPRPQPSRAELRGICAWLEPRRLVTTELHVIGPAYTRVTRFEARVTVSAAHDLATVQAALYDAILTFLHPVRGGRDGTGWPFGADIYYGDLYDLMLGVPGLRRVSGLAVDTEAGAGDAAADIAAIPEGTLPLLLRDVLRLTVSHG